MRSSASAFTPTAITLTSNGYGNGSPDLNGASKMDEEIAAILNQEGFIAARGCAFKGENVSLLRNRWGIPIVKINGIGSNPMRWPDGRLSPYRALLPNSELPRRLYSIISHVGSWLGIS